MTPDTTPAPMGPYKVTSQVEGQYQMPSGQYGAGVKVTFATNDGIQGSVVVPEAAYSRDAVRAAIASKLAAMRDVANLSG